MHERVMAVVVTYNRSRLLLECLSALLRQTSTLDRIVLVDNASTDDTVEQLRSHGYLDRTEIDYTRLPTNTGGAGGFHEGVRRAMELGADWAWVMDDDAEPREDAVQRMKHAFSRPNIGGVANLVVRADGNTDLEHRGWLQLRGLAPRAHRPIDAAAASGGDMDISFASFVGLAVSRAAVARVGLPKRDMFIKGDDLEYCVRLSQVGPIVLVPGSVIRHKDAVSAAYEHRRRFGLQSARVPLDKLWLNYFALRNMVWMRRTYCGQTLAAVYAAQQFVRRAVGIILFDTHRWVRLRFYFCAIADAWRGEFDNDKPKRLSCIERGGVRRYNPG